MHCQHSFSHLLGSSLTYNIWCCWSLAVACGGLSAWKRTPWYITPWQWTTCTYPGCRNWGRRSRRRSRCGVPAPTCCWRCERSWTPADKCSRRAGTWAEARWRSPAMLSESGPPTLVSIGSTWNRSLSELHWSGCRRIFDTLTARNWSKTVYKWHIDTL